MLIFVVGVYFTQIVADARSDGNEVLRWDTELRHYWGNLGFGVLTLYEVMTGGVDWDDVARPLMDDVHPMMVVLLVAYVAITTFVMMNLVTGIFVESARENIREDQDYKLVNAVRELFLKSDTERTGEITQEEFIDQVCNPLMEEYFKSIDLDISEAPAFFQLLDSSKNGKIDSEEFVHGCLRLRGTAKAIDHAILLELNRHVFKNVLPVLSNKIDSLLEMCAGQLRENVPMPRGITPGKAAPHGNDFMLDGMPLNTPMPQQDGGVDDSPTVPLPDMSLARQSISSAAVVANSGDRRESAIGSLRQAGSASTGALESKGETW
jgi:hypothetical protein